MLGENRTFGQKYRASEKKARESDLGTAPRGQSPEVRHSEGQNSAFRKRDLTAENGAQKGPGGGSATTI
jgi:hypothetical protein